jgi:hypothetical protein
LANGRGKCIIHAESAWPATIISRRAGSGVPPRSSLPTRSCETASEE